MAAQIFVVMGVSGCGKSSLGARLAAALDIAFLEGDTLHTPASISKMAAGTPLADDDRAGWLQAIALRLVYLHGSRAVLASRMAARAGHYMPASLLDSQLATWEPPAPDEHALAFDVAQSLDRVAAQVLAAAAPA